LLNILAQEKVFELSRALRQTFLQSDLNWHFKENLFFLFHT